MSEQRPRIAICTSVHAAEDARITFREARALAREFDVTLFTLDAGPDSRIDAGGGRCVEVVRLGPGPVSRVGRFFAGRGLLKSAMATRPDLVLVHDPELLVWLRLLAVGRTATAYDAHEDYARMMLSKVWVPAPLRRLVAWAVDVVERSSVRRLDLLLVADDHLTRRLARTGVETVVVRNYPPSDLFLAGPPLAERGLEVVYVGTVNLQRGVASMLEAFKLVRAQLPEARLRIVGPALDESARAAGAGTEGVTATGRVSYDQVGPVLEGARVGLALLQDIPKYRDDIPSKLYDYMAAGVPYVASDLPGIRRVMGETGGVLVDPCDPARVADAILSLLVDGPAAERLREHALAESHERFTFEVDARKMVDAVRRAVGRAG